MLELQIPKVFIYFYLCEGARPANPYCGGQLCRLLWRAEAPGGLGRFSPLFLWKYFFLLHNFIGFLKRLLFTILRFFLSQVDKKAESIIDAERRKEALGVEKAGLVCLLFFCQHYVWHLFLEILGVILMKGRHTDWVTRAVFICSAFTIKDQQVHIRPSRPVIIASVTYSNKALFRIFSFQGWLQPARPHETVKV